MKRVMLIGECGSGKSSLIRALSDEAYKSRRAMAVEYHGRFINTPGEFLENRRFYTALITASADCDIVLMLHDAPRSTSLFPPSSASVFNRRVIGVVSRIDADGADAARAERLLLNAGAKEIFHTSVVTGAGLEELRAAIS